MDALLGAILWFFDTFKNWIILAFVVWYGWKLIKRYYPPERIHDLDKRGYELFAQTFETFENVEKDGTIPEYNKREISPLRDELLEVSKNYLQLKARLRNASTKERVNLAKDWFEFNLLSNLNYDGFYFQGGPLDIPSEGDDKDYDKKMERFEKDMMNRGIERAKDLAEMEQIQKDFKKMLANK